MSKRTKSIHVLLLTAAVHLPAAAQSHVEQIESIPCLHEYRLWYFTFRRPEPFPKPSDFSAQQCESAAREHERIERERAEAEEVKDPSPGPNDDDERAIDCLHEYRLWRSITGPEADFIAELITFGPFKVNGERQCRAAKIASDEIRIRNLRKAAAIQAESARIQAGRDAVPRDHRAREAAALAARQARARMPPPKIGMTQDQVAQGSNWGQPTSKRRTTTAEGVREQWIYPSNRYLYFNNNRLTAIEE